MQAPATPRVVIVVSESDEILSMATASIEALGPRLRSIRAVRAEAARFAASIAEDPSPLSVQVFDVVGYCAPERDRPRHLEPIVIEDGKPVA